MSNVAHTIATNKTIRKILRVIAISNNSQLQFFPYKQIVFKAGAYPSGIFQPGQIGADRAAHKDILLEIHGQRVFGKQLLKQRLKAKWFGSELHDFFRDLQNLLNITLGQFRDSPGGRCMGRNEQIRVQGFYHFQCLQVSRGIVEKADLIFVQGLTA